MIQLATDVLRLSSSAATTAADVLLQIEPAIRPGELGFGCEYELACAMASYGYTRISTIMEDR